MNTSPQTVSISRLKQLAPDITGYCIGDDFILMDVDGTDIEKSKSLLDLLKYPLRFDGVLCLYGIEGSLDVEINSVPYNIGPRNFFIYSPGNIVKMQESAESSILEVKFIFIAMSINFYSSLHLDLASLSQSSVRELDTPCITLDDKHLSIANDYYNLASKIIHSAIPSKREVIGALLSSIIYIARDALADNISESSNRPANSAIRLKRVFENFMLLVRENYTTERNMAFYADKMCLSPKYLSKLVKQASGRSAPEWIDTLVILEAKNLLRYSDYSIKEIVFRLHFPNQSVFYKFFKAHTGMTPSEYRRQ